MAPQKEALNYAAYETSLMHPFKPNVNLMMDPGPSTVPQRILDASARPTIGHLDPNFVALMDEIKALLRYAFQTNNRLTFPVSAPGSAGMEMCFVNLLEAGDKAIICKNGVFGERMVANAQRVGARVIEINDDWGKPVSVEKVEEALFEHPDAQVLAFVHAETSTGALSDAKKLCELAQQQNALTIVDTVTSLGGVELLVDEWGIDATYSGSQKCLSVPPGLSPVSFSGQAIEKITSRKTDVQSWFLDLNLIINYWQGEGKRSYHHTAPVNAMYGMHEGLLMLREEGLLSAWKRHKDTYLILRDGLLELGFSYFVEESARLPQLNSVYLPKDVDDEAALRRVMLEKYNIEIGGGLGDMAGKIWRIGLMGNTAYPENVERFLNAIRKEIG